MLSWSKITCQLIFCAKSVQDALGVSSVPPKKRRWGADYGLPPAKPQPDPSLEASAPAALIKAEVLLVLGATPNIELALEAEGADVSHLRLFMKRASAPGHQYLADSMSRATSRYSHPLRPRQSRLQRLQQARPGGGAGARTQRLPAQQPCIALRHPLRRALRTVAC